MTSTACITSNLTFLKSILLNMDQLIGSLFSDLQLV